MCNMITMKCVPRKSRLNNKQLEMQMVQTIQATAAKISFLRRPSKAYLQEAIKQKVGAPVNRF